MHEKMLRKIFSKFFRRFFKCSKYYCLLLDFLFLTKLNTVEEKMVITQL